MAVSNWIFKGARDRVSRRHWHAIPASLRIQKNKQKLGKNDISNADFSGNFWWIEAFVESNMVIIIMMLKWNLQKQNKQRRNETIVVGSRDVVLLFETKKNKKKPGNLLVEWTFLKRVPIVTRKKGKQWRRRRRRRHRCCWMWWNLLSKFSYLKQRTYFFNNLVVFRIQFRFAVEKVRAGVV